MVNTPVELVGGTSQGIVTIHEIGIDDGPDSLFTPLRTCRIRSALAPCLGFGVPGSRAIAGP